MIEAGLVYIHSDKTPKGFIGCGALVEGPFIVTCRHVWEDARAAAAGKPVLVCFPPYQGDGDPVFSPATLADSCDQDTNPPDLVILEAESPSRNAALSVACAGVAETGPAILLMGLRGRDMMNPYAIDQNTVGGALSSIIASNRLRQFTGEKVGGYWPDHGSSGSPVGLRDGTTLAGILCRSETSPPTAPAPGEARIHEAFVLPASTIHRCLRALVGRRAAERHKVDPARMPGILKVIRADELSLAGLRSNLDDYFDSVQVPGAMPRAAGPTDGAGDSGGEDVNLVASPAHVANDAVDRARVLNARFEPAAAMTVLDEALGEEARTNGKRLLPLLVEKARQHQLVLDHQGAIAFLTVITTLDPDSRGVWIALGDAWQRIGNLKSALDAFRGGLLAAGRADSRSDLAIAHGRVGEALRHMGDLNGALAEARAGLAIAQRAARQDMSHAELRREVSVSHNNIGVILAQQCDFGGALAEFNAGLGIVRHLCELDPGQAGLQHDLSISNERIGGVLLACGNLPAALAAFETSLAIRDALFKQNPGRAEWQRELGVGHHKVGETLRAQATLDTKSGDAEQAQQKLAAALASFRAALAAFETLAAGDSDNADHQRDVSAAHNNIGGILLLQGNPTDALAAYRANLAIAERLVDRDPDRADWQRDVLVSCVRMASVDPAGRRPWLSRALAIATRLAQRGRLAPADAGMIPSLQARLAALPPEADPSAGSPAPTG